MRLIHLSIMIFNPEIKGRHLRMIDIESLRLKHMLFLYSRKNLSLVKCFSVFIIIVRIILAIFCSLKFFLTFFLLFFNPIRRFNIFVVWLIICFILIARTPFTATYIFFATFQFHFQSQSFIIFVTFLIFYEAMA